MMEPNSTQNPEAPAGAPKRRRWRFCAALSLRTMMFLVLVVAMPMAWRVNKARQQREAAQAVRDFGGTVHYDWEFVIGPGVRPPTGIYWRDVWGKFTPGRKPKAPVWLRRAIGDEYFQEITHVSMLRNIANGKSRRSSGPADDVLHKLSTQTGVRTLELHGDEVTEKGLAYLANLTSLEDLLISSGCPINDQNIVHLTGLTSLRVLAISGKMLTDEALKDLSNLKNLEQLILHEGQGFSNKGLAHLEGMSRLQSLELGTGSHTITDEGLDSLQGMTELAVLNIRGWQVTETGWKKLIGLKNLKILIVGLDDYHEETLARMRSARPSLRITSY
jgi:hypothetical protein